MKELAILDEDFNYLNSRRAFTNLFRKYATGRNFLVVNFTNKDGIYMDSEFKTIKI